MKPGIYPNLSNEYYHGHKESYSRSALMEFKKSPYHYWSKYINPNYKEPVRSDALNFGAAFHMFVLEYELFKETYIIEPPTLLLKNVGREKYEENKAQKLAAKLSRQPTITEEEFHTIQDMAKALVDNLTTAQLIFDATYEQSLFWEDKDSGLLLKARPDIMHSNMIVVLKTCNDASPEAFQYAMAKNGYHVQGAMIREGWKILTGEVIDTVINICIEKTYPHAIGIYIIDELALSTGEAEFKRLAYNLRSAIDSNDWPSYNACEIGLPKWAL